MWKQIKNYSKYSVSNKGKVRNSSTGKILKPIINDKGYHKVSLYNDSGLKQFYVHRLVAIYFLQTDNKDLQVNHKDDNKSNNCSDNLYWGTQSENLKDCYKNGYNSHLKKRILRIDKQGNKKEYNSVREASLDVKGNENAISNVLKNRAKTSAGYFWKYNN